MTGRRFREQEMPHRRERRCCSPLACGVSKALAGSGPKQNAVTLRPGCVTGPKMDLSVFRVTSSTHYQILRNVAQR